MRYSSLVNAQQQLKAGFILISICLFQFTSSKAQSNYQAGVIITNEGKMVRGLIDNRDWLESPEEIRFKKDSISTAKAYTPSDISGFRVAGQRYESRTVKIDNARWKGIITSGNTTRSSTEDTVFLAVLVKGPLNLFYYRDFRDHFYIEDSNQITELIAQKYVVEREGKSYIATNEGYKDQLLLQSNQCPEVETKNLSYSKKSLIGFTVDCNKNISHGSVQFVYEPERASFSTQVFAGITNTNFDLQFGENSVGFTTSRNFTFGISTLLTFPKNRGRGSVFTDIQYYRFESSNQQPYANRSENYICINSQCSGSTRDEFIENMRVETDYLKLALGYRHKFRSGTFRPFVDLGLSISKRLSYQAQGVYDVRIYSYEGSGRPDDDQLILEDSFQGEDEIATSGNFTGGVVGGLGTQIGPANITLRGEMNYVSNDYSFIKSLTLLISYTLFK